MPFHIENFNLGEFERIYQANPYFFPPNSGWSTLSQGTSNGTIRIRECRSTDRKETMNHLYLCKMEPDWGEIRREYRNPDSTAYAVAFKLFFLLNMSDNINIVDRCNDLVREQRLCRGIPLIPSARRFQNGTAFREQISELLALQKGISEVDARDARDLIDFRFDFPTDAVKPPPKVFAIVADPDLTSEAIKEFSDVLLSV